MPENDFLNMLLSTQQSPTQPTTPRRRRRGGLAGIWDRNKNVITPIVAGGLGALTGGLAAPIVAGGLMRGLDRPGRGGIGFDVGAGARGALEGAGAGSVGQMARGAATRLLGRGATAASSGGQAAGLRGADMTPTATAGGSVATPNMGAPIGSSTPLGVGAGVAQETARSSSALGDYVRGGASAVGRGLRAAGNFARQNPEAIGAGLQAGAGILGSQAEREMADERIALERERDEEERRRRETIARLLLPMFQQMQAQQGGI